MNRRAFCLRRSVKERERGMDRDKREEKREEWERGRGRERDGGHKGENRWMQRGSVKGFDGMREKEG